MVSEELISETYSSHGMTSPMISRNSFRFVFFFRQLHSKSSCLISLEERCKKVFTEMISFRKEC